MHVTTDYLSKIIYTLYTKLNQLKVSNKLAIKTTMTNNNIHNFQNPFNNFYSIDFNETEELLLSKSLKCNTVVQTRIASSNISKNLMLNMKQYYSL